MGEGARRVRGDVHFSGVDDDDALLSTENARGRGRLRVRWVWFRAC